MYGNESFMNTNLAASMMRKGTMLMKCSQKVLKFFMLCCFKLKCFADCMVFLTRSGYVYVLEKIYLFSRQC